ncbi:MAG: hypothetical protein Q7U08_02995 [Flavobacteriaceae bacterium]|nr:hypothetical protein [Flavobacteriaceae bacterium]
MKKIIIIIVFLICIKPYGQNITGSWLWKSSNGKDTFELNLTPISRTSTSIEGSHCSVFQQGLKIDCVENLEEISINLTMVSTNIYQGTIKSNYCYKNGTIKLIYDSNTDVIQMELIDKPNGEFYIPNTAVFVRIN